MNKIILRFSQASLCLGIVLALPLFAAADVSPLCSDLATFACAPGTYKDGTGEVKSESEIQRFMSAYAEKTRTQLHDRFASLLKDPANSYFKSLAIAGMGLKNSPTCTSQAAEDVAQCQENLIDGLTTLTQRQTLGPLLPQTGLERQGNLRDLAYVLENHTYQKLVDDFNHQVQNDLGNPEMTKKIQEKIFPKVKDLMISRLKQMSLSDDQRNLMISKINSISFEGSSCGEMGSESKGRSNDEVVSALLVPDAFYDPGRNIFKFCAGYLLQSNSEFQIVTTLAHELSHSIDPCIIAMGPADLGFAYKNPGDLSKMQNEYPIKNIIQCLRDPRSVGAQHFAANMACPTCIPNASGGGIYGRYDKKNTSKEGVSSPYGYTAYAGRGMGMPISTQKASFCEDDQIGESFADWMSAEVLPQYLEQNYKLSTDQYRNGYGNARRLICKIPKSGEGNRDVHPPIEARINRILLMNPKVRAQMGCQEMPQDRVYCDPEKPLSPLGVSPGTALPQNMVPQNNMGGGQ